ncbi:MAG: TRAP transporter small permease subunit [Chloroflexota bacterium]
MARFASWVDRISYVLTFLGGIMLLLMTALVTVEVTMRYGFRTSTLVADELAPYLLVGMLYFGLAYGLQKDRHVKVELATARMRPRTKRYLRQFLSLLTVPLAAICLWRIGLLVWESYRLGVSTPGMLHTPQYLPQILVLVGLLVFLLQAAVQVRREFSPAERRAGAAERLPDEVKEE